MEAYSILGFEDPIDSWTHLLGAVAVGILLIKLLRKGAIGRNYLIPVLIYGLSCILLLSMSGIYHMQPRDNPVRYVLRILDHAAIFLLIAGTITALHAILFSGFMKWGMISIAWLIAAMGIIFGSIYFNDIPAYITHLVYLTFGWLGVISVIGICKLKKSIAFKYLIYGGVAYTFGATIDWLQYPVLISGLVGPHEIFHIFVLGGIAFHWVFLLQSMVLVNTYKPLTINECPAVAVRMDSKKEVNC